MTSTIDSEVPEITLGGERHPVKPIPFGTLRRVLPAVKRASAAMAAGAIDEAAMADVGLVLAAGMGVTPEELDRVPIRSDEIGPAFSVIMDVAGLAAPGVPSAGENKAGATPGTGTISTPISPPASDGPGPRSTN